MSASQVKHLVLAALLPVVAQGCQSFDQRSAEAPVPLNVYQAPSKAAPSSAPQAATSAQQRSSKTAYFGAAKQAAPTLTRKGADYDYASDGVDLNFRGAPIAQIVDVILGDLLERDYVIDPDVQGQVTLRTGRPITLGSLLPALEAALSDVGAALIERNGRLEIVPRSTLRLADLPLTTPPQAGRVRPAGYALEIFPLQYSLPTEVEQLLRPLASDGSIAQVSDRHGHIILAGSSAQRGNLARLIRTFDVDWLENRSFALYPLDHVQPDTLIAQMTDVLGLEQDRQSAQTRLIPLPRMKAILGVAPDRRRLRQLDSWVRRLDVPAQTGERRIHLYHVQNVDAVQLAGTLQKVIGFQTQDRAQGAETTNAQEGQTDQSAQREQTSAAPTPDAAQAGPRIIANEQSNSLMIYATGEEYSQLKETLSLMDVFAQQVMIEAVLAEVTLNDDLSYGLQWSFDDDDVTITSSNADTGTVASEFPGFSVLYTGTSNVRAVLNAIQSVTDLKVLSSPKLLVMNNQTASLQVGDQVPIVTQQSQGTIDDNAPIINTVELRDTGVILEVTPRISESGLVFIEISQEVSDVAQTTTSGIDSPTIQQRQLTTTIGVQDGNTIALGGLIRENKTVSNSGIPLLKDIPLAGNLFRSNTYDSRRTELVILLTPRIVRDAASATDMTTKLLEDFGAFDADTIPVPGS